MTHSLNLSKFSKQDQKPQLTVRNDFPFKLSLEPMPARLGFSIATKDCMKQSVHFTSCPFILYTCFEALHRNMEGPYDEASSMVFDPSGSKESATLFNPENGTQALETMTAQKEPKVEGKSPLVGFTLAMLPAMHHSTEGGGARYLMEPSFANSTTKLMLPSSPASFGKFDPSSETDNDPIQRCEEASNSVGNDDDDDEARSEGQRERESSHGGGSNNDKKAARDEEDTPVLAKKETAAVVRLKGIVVLVLVAFTALVSTVVYFYLSSSEQEQFESQYHDDARKVLQGMGISLDQTLGSFDGLAVALVSHARETNQSWPFVTVPDFAVRMSKLLPLTKAININILPIVTPELRSDWEEYTVQNDAWINQGMAVQEAWDGYYGPVVYNGTQLGTVHGDFGDIPINTT
jgi:hypothetical protein